jgi:hypothetical protein
MAERPSFPPNAKHFVNTYEMIGRGITTWSVMEIRLVQIVARLLGTDERKAGLVLYSINNFYSWISIIDGLFDEGGISSKSKTQWSSLTSDLKRLNDIRVRLAHQAVYVDIVESVEGDLVPILSGLKPSPLDTRPKQKKLSPLTYDELVEFNEDVPHLEKKLAAVVSELGHRLSDGH